MKGKLFEIYPTTSFVKSEEWLKLILKISQLNGLFKPWNLWIHIENNYIRYFIETKILLPPVIGELGDFLIKKIDMQLREKSKMTIPFVLFKEYKTLLDVYDRFDTRKLQKIQNVKIMVFPYK